MFFFESKSVQCSKISKIPESSPICVEKRVQWRHWVQMERTLWNSSDSSTLKLWIPRICSFIWSKRRAHNSEKGVDPIERQWKGGMSNCMSIWIFTTLLAFMSKKNPSWTASFKFECRRCPGDDAVLQTQRVSCPADHSLFLLIHCSTYWTSCRTYVTSQTRVAWFWIAAFYYSLIVSYSYSRIR